MGQPGFFDLDERYRRLSENGDPLVKLAALIDFEAFRPKLELHPIRLDQRHRSLRPSGSCGIRLVGSARRLA